MTWLARVVLDYYRDTTFSLVRGRGLRRCLIGGDGGGGSGGWGLGVQEYPHAREQALCPAVSDRNMS
jgi:hypothetical protein